MSTDHSQSNMRGAALMTASMAGYTFNDICMKALAGQVPLFQAVFLRGIFASLFIYLLARHLGALRFDLPRRDWGLIAVRTLGELGATYCFLVALFNMPIANVTAILQALPLTVALAAALFLGEPLGWRRLGAILAGFVGVMLIVQPGGDGFTVWSLYALVAVAFITMRDLAARRLSRDTPSLTVSLIAAIGICLAGGVASMTEVWAPIGLREGAILLLAALFILGGYLASVAVMRVGEIGFVAPFRYTGLLWALVLGWLFFGDWPDALTLAGAGVVVAMGLFTLFRERQLAQRRKASKAA
ncbi:DMT family transporter [Aliiroseovarius sp.]|uniref:DMT family transporter n=1 Tax=Aliiroseovarius sp. TaxID=1872442 RepID=UPI003BA9A7DE